eukprot:4479944-Amphidinium_carterae.2
MLGGTCGPFEAYCPDSMFGRVTSSGRLNAPSVRPSGVAVFVVWDVPCSPTVLGAMDLSGERVDD